MFNDRFAQLLALQFSNEATEEQLAELQRFLEENPNAQFFYEVFSDYWKLEQKEAASDIQDEIHFQQILAIAEKETPSPAETGYVKPSKGKLFTLRQLAVAASLIAVVVLSYFLLRPGTSAVQAFDDLNEVTAEPGSRLHLRLPDGSSVVLNSESKLEYSVAFNGAVREVFLEGEAYFDVVKDKSRPFIVHTSDIDIKVLGTAFNVKSYPKDSVIEATLIHGKIEVTSKKGSSKFILSPHEKLVFNKSPYDQKMPKKKKNEFSHEPLPKNVNDTAIAETGYVYNKLIIDGETFRQIAPQMERWFNVKINFKDDYPGNFGLHYEIRSETIEEALRALQHVERFEYKINGNEIEISKP